MKMLKHILLLIMGLLSVLAKSQVTKSDYWGFTYNIASSKINDDCSCMGIARLINLKKYMDVPNLYSHKIDSCLDNSKGYLDTIKVEVTYKKRNLFGSVRYKRIRHEWLTPMQLAIAYGDLETADKIIEKTDKLDHTFFRSKIEDDDEKYRLNVFRLVSKSDTISRKWLEFHRGLEDKERRKITEEVYSYTLWFDDIVIDKRSYGERLANLDSLLSGKGDRELEFSTDALRYALKYDIDRVFKFILDSSAFRKDSVFQYKVSHGGGVRRRGVLRIPIRSRSYSTEHSRTWKSEMLSTSRFLSIETTFYLLEGEWFTIDELKKFINEKLRTPAQMYKPDKGDRLRYKINLSHHKYFKTYFQLISDEINLNKKKTLTKKLARLDRKHQELIQLIKL